MNNLKLGFFDSGVGGLTVLKSILNRHGKISGVYLGDTKRVPYGKKNTFEINEIAKELVSWLNHQHITALIVACNTTNSLAMELVKEVSKVPVFGLINSVHEGIYESETKIGVLATPSTASSGAYKKAIQLFKPEISVLEQGCPSLVPLIETGQLSSNELRLAVENYLHPLIDNNVDAIILGCSHYPLIENLLFELLPEKVRLIDPAKILAKNLDAYLGLCETSNKNSTNLSNIQFCVTSDPNGFTTRLEHWLGIRPDVQLVSLKSNACVF